EGRKANIVEALTKISSVDWVTKAGAGGKALAIAESERDMDNKDQKVTEEVAPIEETPQVVALVLGAVPVLKALLTSGLPQAAQERLAEGGYADEDALKAAIDAEKAYLDAARPTGGGRPFGMSGTSPKLKEDEKPLAERESAIVKKYTGG
ncbi:hypothetical protein KKH23_06645, partial [Patescibacteria group bacterium]|nr:hypothetical protein [Patescibacteria group bacterium]